MSDAEFKPIRSFDIDDGQLDELTPQQIFVLGYELATVDRAIERGEGFDGLIHVDNIKRIEAHPKLVVSSITFMHDDISESWARLSIPPDGPERPPLPEVELTPPGEPKGPA